MSEENGTTSCEHIKTRVLDSRKRPNHAIEGRFCYRRRMCVKCGARFTTCEIPSEKLLKQAKEQRTYERTPSDLLKAVRDIAGMEWGV